MKQHGSCIGCEYVYAIYLLEFFNNSKYILNVFEIKGAYAP
jgi:hypothetical protein